MRWCAALLIAARLTAGDAPLPPVVADEPGFLVLSELVVVDACPTVPAAVADRPVIALADYLQALGDAKPPFPLGNDLAGAELVRVDARRWLVVVRYRSYVRLSAIAVVDERVASGLLLPPTPPRGADPNKPLAAPTAEATGVTVAAGTARVFCGVRSTGRSLAVGQRDLAALAKLAAVPTAAELAARVAGRHGE